MVDKGVGKKISDASEVGLDTTSKLGGFQDAELGIAKPGEVTNHVCCGCNRGVLLDGTGCLTSVWCCIKYLALKVLDLRPRTHATNFQAFDSNTVTIRREPMLSSITISSRPCLSGLCIVIRERVQHDLLCGLSLVMQLGWKRETD